MEEGWVVSVFFGAFPDADLRLFAFLSRNCHPMTRLPPLYFFPPLSAPGDTLSGGGGGGSLPPDRLRSADSRPERSQPVRTSSGSASSAHAYRSAHPPWAVPAPSLPLLSLFLSLSFFSIRDPFF